jgi:hypothetical protein
MTTTLLDTLAGQLVVHCCTTLHRSGIRYRVSLAHNAFRVFTHEPGDDARLVAEFPIPLAEIDTAIKAIRTEEIEAAASLTMQAPRKKRVGDVWANPRGRRYRIVGFERPGRLRVVSVSSGTADGAVSSLMGPENSWSLVQAGDGEEEPARIVEDVRASATAKVAYLAEIRPDGSVLVNDAFGMRQHVTLTRSVSLNFTLRSPERYADADPTDSLADSKGNFGPTLLLSISQNEVGGHAIHWPHNVAIRRDDELTVAARPGWHTQFIVRPMGDRLFVSKVGEFPPGILGNSFPFGPT